MTYAKAKEWVRRELKESDVKKLTREETIAMAKEIKQYYQNG